LGPKRCWKQTKLVFVNLNNKIKVLLGDIAKPRSAIVDGVLAGRQWWEAKEVHVDGLQIRKKSKYNNFSEHI
jgi:hypothetical protein